MQAENVLKSLVFNGWKHFHVIIQPGMQEGNEALGFIKFLGEKGIFALEFVAFFFVGGEEADGADEAGELADVGDGFLGVDEEVAGEAGVCLGGGDLFDSRTIYLIKNQPHD